MTKEVTTAEAQEIINKRNAELLLYRTVARLYTAMLSPKHFDHIYYTNYDKRQHMFNIAGTVLETDLMPLFEAHTNGYINLNCLRDIDDEYVMEVYHEYNLEIIGDEDGKLKMEMQKISDDLKNFLWMFGGYTSGNLLKPTENPMSCGSFKSWIPNNRKDLENYLDTFFRNGYRGKGHSLISQNETN